MVMFRKADPPDSPKILALQKDNLIQNLPPRDQQDGFFSIEYTHDQLKRFNNERGMKIVDEFEFNEQKHWILVFEVKSKVQKRKKP
jgi:hypothetical protein